MIPAALRSRIVQATAGGAVALAVAVVAYFEGYEPTPYLDPVGIVTVCTGHTGGIEADRTYSAEECETLLRGDLGKAFAALDRHVTVPLGEPTRAAIASFIFNVGEGAFMRSTFLRRLNAGHGAASCDELLRWVYAGGRRDPLPGLVTRRQAERELCRDGFARVAPIPLPRPDRRAA